ncbi:MAG: class I SAM-dependent methyltransferase [Candidatus Paceibacterota bacterium]
MFTNPEQNILHLGLTEGMRVADFGAGTGFYSKAASAKVGYTGKVYAIEVQKDLVKRLESEIKSWGILNIDCIWGDIEKRNGTKISDQSVDVVIVSNVLFQAEDKLGLIDEAKRVLKKGGKVLLIDWSDSFGGMGPTTESVVTESMAKELFEKRGFKLEESISTSAHHYGIIFKYE